VFAGGVGDQIYFLGTFYFYGLIITHVQTWKTNVIGAFLEERSLIFYY
jgi:hypothetical protein